MVNHSARMGELITLNENIAIISKLKKNRKKKQHLQYTQKAN